MTVVRTWVPQKSLQKVVLENNGKHVRRKLTESASSHYRSALCNAVNKLNDLVERDWWKFDSYPKPNRLRFRRAWLPAQIPDVQVVSKGDDSIANFVRLCCASMADTADQVAAECIRILKLGLPPALIHSLVDSERERTPVATEPAGGSTAPHRSNSTSALANSVLPAAPVPNTTDESPGSSTGLAPFEHVETERSGVCDSTTSTALQGPCSIEDGISRRDVDAQSGGTESVAKAKAPQRLAKLAERNAATGHALMGGEVGRQIEVAVPAAVNAVAACGSGCEPACDGHDKAALEQSHQHGLSEYDSTGGGLAGSNGRMAAESVVHQSNVEENAAAADAAAGGEIGILNNAPAPAAMDRVSGCGCADEPACHAQGSALVQPSTSNEHELFERDSTVEESRDRNDRLAAERVEQPSKAEEHVTTVHAVVGGEIGVPNDVTVPAALDSVSGCGCEDDPSCHAQKGSALVPPSPSNEDELPERDSTVEELKDGNARMPAESVVRRFDSEENATTADAVAGGEVGIPNKVIVAAAVERVSGCGCGDEPSCHAETGSALVQPSTSHEHNLSDRDSTVDESTDANGRRTAESAAQCSNAEENNTTADAVTGGENGIPNDVAVPTAMETVSGGGCSDESSCHARKGSVLVQSSTSHEHDLSDCDSTVEELGYFNSRNAAESAAQRSDAEENNTTADALTGGENGIPNDVTVPTAIYRASGCGYSDEPACHARKGSVLVQSSTSHEHDLSDCDSTVDESSDSKGRRATESVAQRSNAAEHNTTTAALTGDENGIPNDATIPIEVERVSGGGCNDEPSCHARKGSVLVQSSTSHEHDLSDCDSTVDESTDSNRRRTADSAVPCLDADEINITPDALTGGENGIPNDATIPTAMDRASGCGCGDEPTCHAQPGSAPVQSSTSHELDLPDCDITVEESSDSDGRRAADRAAQCVDAEDNNTTADAVTGGDNGMPIVVPVPSAIDRAFGGGRSKEPSCHAQKGSAPVQSSKYNEDDLSDRDSTVDESTDSHCRRTAESALQCSDTEENNTAADAVTGGENGIPNDVTVPTAMDRASGCGCSDEPSCHAQKGFLLVQPSTPHEHDMSDRDSTVDKSSDSIGRRAAESVAQRFNSTVEELGYFNSRNAAESAAQPSDTEENNTPTAAVTGGENGIPNDVTVPAAIGKVSRCGCSDEPLCHARKGSVLVQSSTSHEHDLSDCGSTVDESTDSKGSTTAESVAQRSDPVENNITPDALTGGENGIPNDATIRTAVESVSGCGCGDERSCHAQTGSAPVQSSTSHEHDLSARDSTVNESRDFNGRRTAESAAQCSDAEENNTTADEVAVGENDNPNDVTVPIAMDMVSGCGCGDEPSSNAQRGSVLVQPSTSHEYDLSDCDSTVNESRDSKGKRTAESAAQCSDAEENNTTADALTGGENGIPNDVTVPTAIYRASGCGCSDEPSRHARKGSVLVQSSTSHEYDCLDCGSTVDESGGVTQRSGAEDGDTAAIESVAQCSDAEANSTPADTVIGGENGFPNDVTVPTVMDRVSGCGCGHEPSSNAQTTSALLQLSAPRQHDLPECGSAANRPADCNGRMAASSTARVFDVEQNDVAAAFGTGGEIVMRKFMTASVAGDGAAGCGCGDGPAFGRRVAGSVAQHSGAEGNNTTTDAVTGGESIIPNEVSAPAAMDRVSSSGCGDEPSCDAQMGSALAQSSLSYRHNLFERDRTADESAMSNGVMATLCAAQPSDADEHDTTAVAVTAGEIGCPNEMTAPSVADSLAACRRGDEFARDTQAGSALAQPSTSHKNNLLECDRTVGESAKSNGAMVTDSMAQPSDAEQNDTTADAVAGGKVGGASEVIARAAVDTVAGCGSDGESVHSSTSHEHDLSEGDSMVGELTDCTRVMAGASMPQHSDDRQNDTAAGFGTGIGVGIPKELTAPVVEDRVSGCKSEDERASDAVVEPLTATASQPNGPEMPNMDSRNLCAARRFHEDDVTRLLDQAGDLLEVEFLNRVNAWKAPYFKPKIPPQGTSNFGKNKNRRNINTADDELDQRLARCGAKRGKLTCSIMWNTACNIGLVCTLPSGAKIFFGSRRNRDGEMDVGNQNRFIAQATTSPVENIFFANPARGKYVFEVWCYNLRAKGSGTSTPVTARLLKPGGRCDNKVTLRKGESRVLFTVQWTASDDALALRHITATSAGTKRARQHALSYYRTTLCHAIVTLTDMLMHEWQGHRHFPGSPPKIMLQDKWVPRGPECWNGSNGSRGKGVVSQTKQQLEQSIRFVLQTASDDAIGLILDELQDRLFVLTKNDDVVHGSSSACDSAAGTAAFGAGGGDPQQDPAVDVGSFDTDVADACHDYSPRDTSLNGGKSGTIEYNVKNNDADVFAAVGGADDHINVTDSGGFLCGNVDDDVDSDIQVDIDTVVAGGSGGGAVDCNCDGNTGSNFHGSGNCFGSCDRTDHGRDSESSTWCDHADANCNHERDNHSADRRVSDDVGADKKTDVPGTRVAGPVVSNGDTSGDGFDDGSDITHLRTKELTAVVAAASGAALCRVRGDVSGDSVHRGSDCDLARNSDVSEYGETSRVVDGSCDDEGSRSSIVDGHVGAIDERNGRGHIGDGRGDELRLCENGDVDNSIDGNSDCTNDDARHGTEDHEAGVHHFDDDADGHIDDERGDELGCCENGDVDNRIAGNSDCTNEVAHRGTEDHEAGFHHLDDHADGHIGDERGDELALCENGNVDNNIDGNRDCTNDVAHHATEDHDAGVDHFDDGADGHVDDERGDELGFCENGDVDNSLDGNSDCTNDVAHRGTEDHEAGVDHFDDDADGHIDDEHGYELQLCEHGDVDNSLDGNSDCTNDVAHRGTEDHEAGVHHLDDRADGHIGDERADELGLCENGDVDNNIDGNRDCTNDVAHHATEDHDAGVDHFDDGADGIIDDERGDELGFCENGDVDNSLDGNSDCTNDVAHRGTEDHEAGFHHFDDDADGHIDDEHGDELRFSENGDVDNSLDGNSDCTNDVAHRGTENHEAGFHHLDDHADGHIDDEHGDELELCENGDVDNSIAGNSDCTNDVAHRGTEDHEAGVHHFDDHADGHIDDEHGDELQLCENGDVDNSLDGNSDCTNDVAHHGTEDHEAGVDHFDDDADGHIDDEHGDELQLCEHGDVDNSLDGNSDCTNDVAHRGTEDREAGVDHFDDHADDHIDDEHGDELQLCENGDVDNSLDRNSDCTNEVAHRGTEDREAGVHHVDDDADGSDGTLDGFNHFGNEGTTKLPIAQHAHNGSCIDRVDGGDTHSGERCRDSRQSVADHRSDTCEAGVPVDDLDGCVCSDDQNLNGSNHGEGTAKLQTARSDDDGIGRGDSGGTHSSDKGRAFRRSVTDHSAGNCGVGLPFDGLDGCVGVVWSGHIDDGDTVKLHIAQKLNRSNHDESNAQLPKIARNDDNDIWTDGGDSGDTRSSDSGGDCRQNVIDHGTDKREVGVPVDDLDGCVSGDHIMDRSGHIDDEGTAKLPIAENNDNGSCMDCDDSGDTHSCDSDRDNGKDAALHGAASCGDGVRVAGHGGNLDGLNDFDEKGSGKLRKAEGSDQDDHVDSSDGGDTDSYVGSDYGTVDVPFHGAAGREDNFDTHIDGRGGNVDGMNHIDYVGSGKPQFAESPIDDIGGDTDSYDSGCDSSHKVAFYGAAKCEAGVPALYADGGGEDRDGAEYGNDSVSGGGATRSDLLDISQVATHRFVYDDEILPMARQRPLVDTLACSASTVPYLVPHHRHRPCRLRNTTSAVPVGSTKAVPNELTDVVIQLVTKASDFSV